MIITKASKQDLQTILELQYIAFQSEAELLNDPNIPPLKQTLQEIQADYQKGIVLKAFEENDTIIGSVRAYCNNSSVLISKLIVHPSWQRMGIATKLLLEIERLYPHKRLELFTSTQSIGNIKLYERLGYKIYKENDVSHKLRLLYLGKI